MLRYLFILSLVMVMSSLGTTVHAEPLGRLFTTPEERIKLDQSRKLGDHAPVAPEYPLTQAPPPPTSELTVDGYVTRSSGRSTTWINQIPHNENDPANSVVVLQRLSHPPVITLQTQSGKRISVKVGETLDVHTGMVREVYEPAAVELPVVTGKMP